MKKRARGAFAKLFIGAAVPILVAAGLLLNGCTRLPVEDPSSEIEISSEIESAGESSEESEESKPDPQPVVLDFHPHCVEGTEPENLIRDETVWVNGEIVEHYQAEKVIEMMDNHYSDYPGIFTFRGNNFRDSAVYGDVNCKVGLFNDAKTWTRETTGCATPDGSYWTGNGWTGQPLMRAWTQSEKAHMNMYDWAKRKEDLVEVIYASLDGYIYFLDLETGEDTRDPYFLGYVFKGAGSLDPRGLPIMYVGSGYESGPDGCSYIFAINLIDCSVLYQWGWADAARTRNIPYFDSSPLVCAETDQLIYPGENGVLYILTLNTKYDEAKGEVSIDPDPIVKYTYRNYRGLLGMEDSCDIYSHYLFVTTNGGELMCVDLTDLHCVWAQDVLDDTNDSPVMTIEDGKLYIYISTSFRAWYRYGEDEIAPIPIWKIDAETGEVVWSVTYHCSTIEDVSGGVQGTAASGRGTLEDLIYFPVSRTPDMYLGKLVALSKSTGKVVWEFEMPYSWSSPVCVYGEDGYGYVINVGFDGVLYMLDGLTGEVCDTIELGSNTEASPAVYNNTLVVGTRQMLIYGIPLR